MMGAERVGPSEAPGPRAPAWDKRAYYLPRIIGRKPMLSSTVVAVLGGKYEGDGLVRTVKHRDHTRSYVLTDAGRAAIAKAPRLTDGQRRVLLLARDGRPIDSGVYGMSAYGGLATILASCRRRGWLDGADRITDAGRAALAASRSTEGSR